MCSGYSLLHFPKGPEFYKFSDPLPLEHLSSHLSANLSSKSHCGLWDILKYPCLSSFDVSVDINSLMSVYLGTIAPWDTFPWLSPRREHSVIMKVLLLLNLCLYIRSFMSLVNKRYQHRTGRNKAFYHMIDVSNFGVNTSLFYQLPQKTWKPELGKGLQEKEHSQGLERIEQICSVDPMTLINMYRTCHALISY